MLFQEIRKENNGNFLQTGPIQERKTCSLCRTKEKLERSQIVEYGVFSEKASLCASKNKICRGSLAVETALVLPLFLFGMITMISFMDIYKLQTEHLQSLCQKAKEAGMYAYVLDGSAPDEITLPDAYSYTPVGALVPLSKVWMVNSVKVHAWTGAEEDSFSAAEEEAEEMVYVTESGSVYHTNPGCHYLNLSIDQVSGSQIGGMRNSYGEKYSACDTCSRGQSPAGSVYVTSNGNHYHNLETCSGLKRNVKLVKASETSGMHVCSRCG